MCFFWIKEKQEGLNKSVVHRIVFTKIKKPTRKRVGFKKVLKSK
jgi:hypothetical protein